MSGFQIVGLVILSMLSGIGAIFLSIGAGLLKITIGG